MANEELRAIMRGMALLKMALGVSVLALCSCSSLHDRSPQPSGSWLGEIKGRADARKDLKAGKLRVEAMGGPSEPWEGTNVRLLKERYGIEFDLVAGCVVSDSVIGHAKGYNEIMGAEIDRRFGKDVLGKTAEEARKKTLPPTP